MQLLLVMSHEAVWQVPPPMQSVSSSHSTQAPLRQIGVLVPSHSPPAVVQAQVYVLTQAPSGEQVSSVQASESSQSPAAWHSTQPWSTHNGVAGVPEQSPGPLQQLEIGALAHTWLGVQESVVQVSESSQSLGSLQQSGTA